MVSGGFSVNATEVESEVLRTISIVDEDLGLSGATAHRSVLQ